MGTFNVVHEHLFHAFVVSEDLQFFEHAHRARQRTASFSFRFASQAPAFTGFSVTFIRSARRRN